MLEIEWSSWYLNWICSMIFPDESIKNRYSKVILFLHNTRYEYTLDLDENRKKDGIALRYHFSCACNVPKEIIENSFDRNDCSVLEMMAGLAKRCDNDIMFDIKHGDRTSLWFWIMFCNLGLNNFDDSVWNENTHYIIANILNKFFRREYYPDGSNGGLFITKNAIWDMRNIQIWDQLNIFMSENNFD